MSINSKGLVKNSFHKNQHLLKEINQLNRSNSPRNFNIKSPNKNDSILKTIDITSNKSILRENFKN